MGLNSVISSYLVVGVVIICCCIGYVIKTSLDFIPNKYIPLIMLVLGIVFNVWFNRGFSLDVIIGGAISGLSSTGFYEAFRNIIENK